MWLELEDEARDIVAKALHGGLRLDAQRLTAIEHGHWHPHTLIPPGITRYTQHSQPLSNGYFFLSPDQSEAAVVDPAGDATAIGTHIEAAGRPLRYICITHRHNDHADAAAALLARYPQAQILMHAAEAAARNDLPALGAGIIDQQRIAFGNGTIEIIVTPGHTDGSSCFYFGDVIFVGDTLFAGSIGRNFGPMTTAFEQLANIRTRILSLPATTTILPGHGPATTVALEKAHNPFFSNED